MTRRTIPEITATAVAAIHAWLAAMICLLEICRYYTEG